VIAKRIRGRERADGGWRGHQTIFRSPHDNRARQRREAPVKRTCIKVRRAVVASSHQTLHTWLLSLGQSVCATRPPRQHSFEFQSRSTLGNKKEHAVSREYPGANIGYPGWQHGVPDVGDGSCCPTNVRLLRWKSPALEAVCERYQRDRRSSTNA
jgi:hypothetical protein